MSDMQKPHQALSVAVTAAAGKMGRAVLSAVLDRPSEFYLAAALHHQDSSSLGVDVGTLIAEPDCGVLLQADWPADPLDVVIDFSLPGPSLAHLAQCVAKNTPIVIGTTGFTAEQKAEIVAAAHQIPVILASNMSVGVNLCFYLLGQITEVMGEESDIEIIETHHKHKLDAPSGTALRMGEVIAETLNQNLEDVAVYDRSSLNTPRTDTEIGFSSIRAADVVGDHTVLFANSAEKIELTHKATSRQTFAEGSLRAARWLVGRENGLYDMQDVLNLRR